MNSPSVYESHRLVQSNKGSLNEEKGSLDGKSVVWGGKGLSIVLILLGVVGIGVAAAGFASFGGYQQWWSAGALSQIEQVTAIAMMVAGGVGGIACIITGAVGFVKQNRIDHEKNRIEGLKILYSEDLLCTRLKDNQYTFVIQTNGKYSLIVKQGNLLRTLRTDISLEPSGNVEVPQDIRLKYENHLYTSVTPSVANRIKELLKQGLQNQELTAEIDRICDDGNFRIAPLEYLAPFIARHERRERLMDTRNITDRAVHYFLANKDVMTFLGKPPESEKRRDRANYRSVLSESDSD